MSKGFVFPQLLSYSASLNPSLASFYAVNGEQLVPVAVIEESLRGVIANYGAEKKEKNPGRPNLQLVDRAFLPAQADTCKVRFTLTVLPNVQKPHACNNLDVNEQLHSLVRRYGEKGGMHYLARKYAENIARGRWLWRNKGLVDQLVVEVKVEDQLFCFQLDREGGQRETLSSQPENALDLLADQIAIALIDERARTLLEIEATLPVGAGQEIYPSQELPLEGEDRRAGGHKKSRILASIAVDGVDQAVMHSQKVGNAIRTIDSWYPNAEPNYPLAVEPFGVDGGLQIAHRANKKSSFYGLLESRYGAYMQALDEIDDAAQLEGELEQLHFVIACLIRGGVFSNEKSNS